MLFCGLQWFQSWGRSAMTFWISGSVEVCKRMLANWTWTLGKIPSSAEICWTTGIAPACAKPSQAFHQLSCLGSSSTAPDGIPCTPSLEAWRATSLLAGKCRNIWASPPRQTSMVANLVGKVELGTSSWGTTVAVAKQPYADARRTCANWFGSSTEGNGIYISSWQSYYVRFNFHSSDVAQDETWGVTTYHNLLVVSVACCNLVRCGSTDVWSETEKQKK